MYFAYVLTLRGLKVIGNVAHACIDAPAPPCADAITMYSPAHCYNWRTHAQLFDENERGELFTNDFRHYLYVIRYDIPAYVSAIYVESDTENYHDRGNRRLD